MKFKFILILFLVFCSLLSKSQMTNVTDYRVQDATTVLGRNISVGVKVYNIATQEYWVAIAPVTSTSTLTTASASFVKLSTDSQTLSTDGNPGNIAISNGNTVNLNVNDADPNPNNEIQTIDVAQLNGTTLELSLLSDGEATKEIDLTALVGTDNQTLSFVDDSLEISNGNKVDLGGLRDGTGTDDQQLSWNGSTGELNIESGNTVDLDGRYLESFTEVDGSVFNEIQTIDVSQLVGTTLELSLSQDGEATKQIDLSSLQDGTGTDNQQLSIDSTGRQFTISIEDGNSVTFIDTNTQLDETAVDNYVSNNGYYTTIDTNDVTGLLEFVENHSDVGTSTVSEKITVSQTTHGLAVDDWIRYNGTAYIKAQGNTPENAEVIGVVDSVIDANTFRYQFSGLYTKGTYTNGAAYFLSPDVSGDAIITPTYETGEVQLFLGTGTPAGFIIEIDVGVQIEQIVSVQNLTTTGNSGAATLIGTTLNIPEYTIGGLGGLPLTGGTISGILNILDNGSTFIIDPHAGGVDLYSTGNISPHYQSTFTLYTGEIGAGVQKFSVDMSGNVSATGTLSAAGYNDSNWNTAYGWGNHAGLYEAVFSKNTAFNKNFGTSAGTVAEGNDSRILNGQTAYNNRIATFTTTGSSGAATFSSNTLNIPNYTLSGLGGMPLSGGTFTGTVTTKKQRLTVLNGSATGTVTHDSNNGDVGAYRVNAASTTVSINNLASGDQGTIFLNFVTTPPTSLTVNTYSDAGSTGLTEVVIGSTPTLAINKSTSITYTCANDGTNTYVYLVYGQQP